MIPQLTPPMKRWKQNYTRRRWFLGQHQIHAIPENHDTQDVGHTTISAPLDSPEMK
jgi:hypothetical protein